jgi:hypothetical protein
MSPITIEEFDSEELEETLYIFTEILKEVGVLKEGTEIPGQIMELEWACDEPDDPDWPRALVKAISSHWTTVTEAQAAALLLKRLISLRPFDLGEALLASKEDNNGSTSFARTMNHVSPEFSRALEENEVGGADIALRMMLSKVFNIDPSNPSDTFFVDATVYAYDEIFEASADQVIRDIMESMAGMPKEAVGFAVVLAGTNGCHELWLRRPDDRAIEALAKVAADVVDKPDADLEEIKKDLNAIAATVTALCTFEQSPEILEHMLGAAAKLLDIQGMLIIADPSSGCKHEALDTGAFRAVRSDDLLALRHQLKSLPAVERFSELSELFEETKEGFNDRLMRLAMQVEDDLE